MKNESRETPEPDSLDVAIEAMGSVEVADVPNDVLRQTRAAMRDASRRHQGRRAALRVAVAAIVVMAVIGMAVFMTQNHRSYAFGEVVERALATKTLRAEIVDSHNGGTLLVSGTRRRFEGGGILVLADSATGQQVMLDVKGKLAYRIPHGGLSQAVDIYGMFRALAAAGSTPIEERQDKTGRRLPGFAGRAELSIGSGAKVTIDAKVWSDLKSKLPVRMEIRTVDARANEPAVVIDEITFDVALDDALFDMTIPAGYRIAGISAKQLKPPLSKEDAAKLTLDRGVGGAKFGMTREQIVASLGEPEFVMGESYLCYPSIGLQLMLGGGKPGKLTTIIANPADAASATQRDFPGQTDRGIRIGSSKQAVRQAYGEPDAPPANEDKRFDILRYEKLGIQFVFIEGKVKQIFLIRQWLESAEEKNKSTK